jgi:hypothetical protein
LKDSRDERRLVSYIVGLVDAPVFKCIRKESVGRSEE